MKDTNSVCIIGRLTADAAIKTFDNGFSIVTFDICSNTSQKNKDGNWEDYPNFFNVKYPGKNLNNFLQYLKKGKQIAVSGSLHQDRWEKDGQKNSRVIIEASDVQLCGGGGVQKKEEGTSYGAPSNFQEDIPY